MSYFTVTRCVALQLGFICISSVAWASNTNPADYTNHLALDSAQFSAREGLYRLKLPAEVYRGVAHADLRDLAIFNAQGERLPHALTRQTTRPQTESLQALPYFPVYATPVTTRQPGPTLTVTLQTDGSLAARPSVRSGTSPSEAHQLTGYLVDASQLKQSFHAFNLEWEPQANGTIAQASLESSNDLKSWRSIVANTSLMSLTFNGAQLSQRRIEFPALSDKYLRLTWLTTPTDTTTTPPLLTRLEAVQSTQTALRDHTTLTFTGKIGTQPGEVLFDSQAPLPVDAVRLILPENNALAPATLLIPAPDQRNAKNPWQPVTQATFYRLNRDGVTLNSPAVALPSLHRNAQWLARIDMRSGSLGQALPELELRNL